VIQPYYEIGKIIQESSAKQFDPLTSVSFPLNSAFCYIFIGIVCALPLVKKLELLKTKDPVLKSWNFLRINNRIPISFQDLMIAIIYDEIKIEFFSKDKLLERVNTVGKYAMESDDIATAIILWSFIIRLIKTSKFHALPGMSKNLLRKSVQALDKAILGKLKVKFSEAEVKGIQTEATKLAALDDRPKLEVISPIVFPLRGSEVEPSVFSDEGSTKLWKSFFSDNNT